MATISPSIESLPVELFHRIFDHLDAQTIIFSFRSVCRLFQSVVNSYDRYKFDFKIISKCNFHRLCRLVPPQHLISLTLYHNNQIPDQISLFIPNYRLRQVTRLRSLNLFGIDEVHFNFILKCINVNFLTSFSLHIQKFDEEQRKTTEHYLSLIMTQPILRKVELNIQEDRISNIKWPVNCRIESLIINGHITTDNIFQIIACSPQLHTLTIKETLNLMDYDLNKKSSFPQIISLTLEKMNMSIDQLELFLSLTPSLIHLRLIGRGCVYDGKRWEKFIEANLPDLKKFEFFIYSWKRTNETRDDLKSILQSFQSPFWIEHKKWFVACAFRLNEPREIQMYSIPIFKVMFNHQLDTNICFLSTSNHFLNLENINEIDLELEHLIDNDLLKTINAPLPNVSKLRLELSNDTSPDSINQLQSIFDISQLVDVHLESSSFYKDNRDLLFAIIKLIGQSSKLISLTIRNLWNYGIYEFLNGLYSILPRQIKYLELPISELEQIEIIFERCPYLSIVKLETRQNKFSEEVAEWFDQNTIDSIFRREGELIHVWIGEKRNQIKENRKRIKLMDNESK